MLVHQAGFTGHVRCRYTDDNDQYRWRRWWKNSIFASRKHSEAPLLTTALSVIKAREVRSLISCRKHRGSRNLSRLKKTGSPSWRSRWGGWSCLGPITSTWRFKLVYSQWQEFAASYKQHIQYSHTAQRLWKAKRLKDNVRHWLECSFWKPYWSGFGFLGTPIHICCSHNASREQKGCWHGYWQGICCFVDLNP